MISEQKLRELMVKDAEIIWNQILRKAPFIKNTSLPLIIIKDLGVRNAGLADRDTCWLNINYAMTVGYSLFYQTIVHELCHCFVGRLPMECDGHGEMWKFMYNIVMEVNRGRFHSYSRLAAETYKEKAKLIKKRDRLKEKLKRMEDEL